MSEKESGNRLKKPLDRNTAGYTADQSKELRRSLVRVIVTYVAAIYLFILGPIVAWMIFGSNTPNVGTAENPIKILAPNVAAAKDLFLSILPIATGIVTYWFATRKSDSSPNQNADGV